MRQLCPMKPAPFFIDIVISYLLTLHCLSENVKTCKNIGKKCLHVAAIIPARAGSKGIKDKNLSIVGNETLVGRTTRIIKKCNKFDSLWVSTDGEKIAEAAAAEGANIYWRDPKTATDNASTVSAIEDFLSKIKDVDIVAVVQCTSPFIRSDFICKAIDHMIATEADCVFSVTRSHQLRWKEREDEFLCPLNFKPDRRPRRQDWRGELVENGMFYISKSSLILKNKIFQNDRCRAYEIPKSHSLEIDTEFDLKLAKKILPLLDD